MSTRMRQLATAALAAGDPLGWYEQLYAEAGIDGAVPWDHREPTPYLVEWLSCCFPAGGCRDSRAVVVGCAYGDDAELLARHGFTTTAFDIADSAIDEAQLRHPESKVTGPPGDRWVAEFSRRPLRLGRGIGARQDSH